jgi:hypothetical protein
MTDVDLEREAEEGVFLVAAFVVLEVDGNGETIAVVAAFSAAEAAAAFLAFAPGLARGLGPGAVLKLPAAAALAFDLQVNTQKPSNKK